MEQYPKVSNAEWEVIKVLWEKSPQTSSEIIEAVTKENDWSPKTIHTLISRLVKKEALIVNKEDGHYQYTPSVSKQALSKMETKSFVKKIYDGSVQLLLSNFIKDEYLSNEEIDELKKILDQKKIK